MSRKQGHIHFKVTRETKRVLERAARKRGVSLSELVRTGAKLFAFEELARPRDEEAENE